MHLKKTMAHCHLKLIPDSSKEVLYINLLESAINPSFIPAP